MEERNLDFDTVVERKNTNCLKYDFAVERGMPEDVLPMWVADMDFRTSSFVEDALVARAKDAIFGYSEMKESYFDAVSGWLVKRHGWQPQKEWLLKTVGVVNAIAMAVKAYTQPGEAVMLQDPVYYPFYEVIADNNRRIVRNTLVCEADGTYHMDLADLEQKIVSEHVKLFLLCSPHNPVGRVWSKEELTALGEILLRHQVVVLSDEIHADFVFSGKHTVFASISEAFAQNAIVCTSASKTFNLASMLVSNIFIPNEALRAKFKKQLDAAGISQLSVLGLVATQEAYAHGETWYQAMHAYVKENIAYVKDFVEKRLPGVRMTPHEGTYLLWLDFNGTGLTMQELDHLIIHEAKLWLDSGRIFGKPGNGYQRINVACQRATLVTAMERIEAALQKINK